MKIKFLNKEFLKIFLYTERRELIDTKFDSMIHPENHDNFRQLMEKIKNNLINDHNEKLVLQIYDNNLEVDNYEVTFNIKKVSDFTTFIKYN